MNYTRTTFVISFLLLSTSLYPAATPARSYDGVNASAAAAPAAEVKRVAAAHAGVALQQQGTAGARYDAEINTEQSKTRRMPPSPAELTQADEIARKLDSPLAILIELARPYEDKDHELFTFELFKKWKSLSEEKNLLYNHGGAKVFTQQNIGDAIRMMTPEQLQAVPRIVWCCLGLASAYSKSHGRDDFVGGWEIATILEEEKEIFDGSVRSLREYGNFNYRSLEVFHDMQQEGAVKIAALAQEIHDATNILLPLATLSAAYYYDDRISVAQSLRDVPGNDSARTGRLSGRMIGSLAGLSKLEFHHCDLSRNRITSIGPDDLPQVVFRFLNVSHNPLREIAPYAFAVQINLAHLVLNDCQLTFISSDMLAGMHELVRLSMNRNRISGIELGALSQLESLRYVYLNDNQLRSVPEDLLRLAQGGTLAFLQLEGNLLEQNPSEYQKKQELLDLVARNKAEADKKKKQQP